MTRLTFGTRRVILVLAALLLAAVFLLPAKSRTVLQMAGKPIAATVALPIRVFSAVDSGILDIWEFYVALRGVREENEHLRRELALLRAQNAELREAAAAGQRLSGLLEFKQRMLFETVAARVLARDASNWFRGVVLDKGERDGVRAEMGVVTSTGVVGRIVKSNPSTSVVLLLTDPNNAVTGLIQRTRDEGIVEGTLNGQARMKYIPLLSTVREGDTIVTSGLTGGFPRGIPIGAITRVEKGEGELFRSADIVPDVDFAKLEEVLVITVPRPFTDEEASPLPPGQSPPRDTTR